MMKTLKLVEKIKLAETVYIVKYEIPEDFDYQPGQYLGIQTAPTHRRAYSIMRVEDGQVWFMVDIKPGGIASKFFEVVEPGAENLILGPYGRFSYQDNNTDKVFISTGTGVVPFIPMIDEIRKLNKSFNLKFIFGARYFEEDVAYDLFKEYIDEKFQYYQCITRPEESKIKQENFKNVIFHKGRVTDALNELNIDWTNTEFYICGGPVMVEDVINILYSKGGDKIFTEKYA